MAATVTSRSTLSAILKNVYVGDIQEAIQNETVFIKDATRKQMPLDGTDLVMAVHLQRNSGIGARAISDDLPSAQTEGVQNGTLRAARSFAAFSLDNELIKLAKRKEAAFEDAMDFTMRSPKTSLLKDLNRQFWGDGSGTLCTLTAVTTTSAVFTVDSTRFLEEGMVFDGWSTATSTTKSVDSAVISTIDSDTQFTATASTSLANAGVIRREDNSAVVSAALVNYECNGIQNICGTATFMGINPATSGNRRWAGQQINAASTDAAPALMFKAQVLLRQSSGAIPNTIYTHPAQEYQLLFGSGGTWQDVRFTAGDANKIGQSAGPSYYIGGNPITIRSDIDAPKTMIFLFDKADLLYGELNGVELEEFGDLDLIPYASSTAGNTKAAVNGWFSWRGNLGAFRRNSFCEIYGLNVPSGM